MLMMEDDGDDDLSIVCKQVVACGSHDSHHMGIVFNEQDVREHFEPPVIVQEFFNHNATIFKIFVVGSQVSVVRRPSIRDVGDSGMTTARHLLVNGTRSRSRVRVAGEAIIFNSQHMQAIIDKAHFESDIDPPHEVLQAIAREITARQVRRYALARSLATASDRRVDHRIER